MQKKDDKRLVHVNMLISTLIPNVHGLQCTCAYCIVTRPRQGFTAKNLTKKLWKNQAKKCFTHNCGSLVIGMVSVCRPLTKVSF